LERHKICTGHQQQKIEGSTLNDAEQCDSETRRFQVTAELLALAVLWSVEVVKMIIFVSIPNDWDFFFKE